MRVAEIPQIVLMALAALMAIGSMYAWIIKSRAWVSFRFDLAGLAAITIAAILGAINDSNMIAYGIVLPISAIGAIYSYWFATKREPRHLAK